MTKQVNSRQSAKGIAMQLPDVNWKWRALLFIAITVFVLTWMESYDQLGLRVEQFPHPSFLGDKWYGPPLLALIPLSLLWLSLSIKRRSMRIILLMLSGIAAFEWFVQVLIHLRSVGKIGF